ncbi:BamA/TamA family outer membrane protein [Alistipes sp.]|uniref:translocation and assembly module lipoprotein TamL n=1 Tax=Alistipes sp. TaxID=1872444 RepID=UPI003AF1D32F
MPGLRRIFAAVALGIVCSACSVTRHIPEGQYFLQKVTIEDDKSTPRKERIPASELEKYVRQTPNKRFLGTNFYVWLYEQADPDKHNGWNNWKRKVGQAPVLLDMALTKKSAENLKIYMDSRGFFSSQATYEVDTTSRRKRAKVTYRTRQREPYRIDTISYEFRDRFLEQIILPDTVNTLLHRGEIFDITMLDRERERITAYLKERGYFNFTVNNIEFVADTLGGHHEVGVRVVVKQHLTGYDERGQAVMDNNMVYRIDRINIFPDYDPTAARTDSTLLQRLDTTYFRGLNVIYENRPNLRPAILRQAVPLYPNYIYNSAQVNKAYTDLMALGYFKTAKIAFVEQPQAVDVTNYVSYIGQGADSTQTTYTREGYLTCNILCTPTLKQSFKIDLEGSTTSSFYGLKATVGYQNRNIFRGAESFDVSFTAGYEFMKAPDAKKKRATEFGVTTGLTFPRFLLPWRTGRYRSVNLPKTKIELSVNFQDRPYYRRTLSSAGLTYQWANKRYSTFSLRPIDINVVDVSYLDPDFLNDTENLYLVNSYKTQFIAGLTFGYGFNNQLKHLGGNATVIRFNAETAGNLIDGLAHLFSHPKGSDDDPYYTIFKIRYSQYFRTDLSLSRKIMLGEKTALAGRLYGGVAMAYGNSTAIPFDRLFYAGGSNSMRGWTPRTLGPGSVPRPDTEFPTQLGDMKLEANLELRFPIWGIVHGATFFDLGNIWFLKSDPGQYSDEAVFYLKNFYKQLGFNTGIGLRFDIKFAVLRLDWGIQLHNPNNPVGERWIHNFRWKNTALNFGVGYPF